MPQFKLPKHYQAIKTIHLACKLGVLADVQQYIFDDPLLVHSLDEYNNSPLYYTSLCGHVDCCAYLLKHGAKDDEYNRSYRNALTPRIREVLKKYIIYDQKVLVLDQQQKNQKCGYESLQVALKNLFGETLREDTTTSDIDLLVSYDQSDSDFEQQVFHCHMIVLISRWRYFRKRYLFDRGQDIGDNDKLSESIAAKLDQMKHDTIVIDDIKPRVFEIMLRYIYTNEFSTGIDPHINPSDKQELNNNRVLLMDLLKAAVRFELDELIDVITEEAMTLNASFNTGIILKSYSVNKKKRRGQRHIASSAGRAFRNSVVTPAVLEEQRSITSKKSQGIRNDALFYDTVDFRIQRYAMYHLSDIVLHATSENDEIAEPIFCHKLLLIERSYYFKMLLTGPFNDFNEMPYYPGKVNCPIVFLDEVDHSILLNLVRHLYTEEASMTSTNAIDLLFASSKYDIPKLKTKCEEFVGSQVTSDNAIDILCLADTLSATELKLKALDFINSAISQKGSDALCKFTDDLENQNQESKISAQDTQRLKEELHSMIQVCN
jgi:hypothetical protein